MGGAVFPPCYLAWGQTMVEVTKIMATSFKRSHAHTAALSAPNPAAGHSWPTPLPETPGYSRASLGQSLVSPWNSSGQNTGVDSLSLLQGIFLTQVLNPGLPHAGRFFTSWATRKAIVLIYIFLMINDVKHFMGLLAVCMFLEKYLFQVLCPFLNWIICFCWVGVHLFWVLTYQKWSAYILSQHVVIFSFFVLWVLKFYVIFFAFVIAEKSLANPVLENFSLVFSSKSFAV